MSRTYRKYPVEYKLLGTYCNFYFTSYIRKKNRDKKVWYKSVRWFKDIKKRERRAKEKDRMVNGDYENIPRFRKANDWEWN